MRKKTVSEYVDMAMKDHPSSEKILVVDYQYATGRGDDMLEVLRIALSRPQAPHGTSARGLQSCAPRWLNGQWGLADEGDKVGKPTVIAGSTPKSTKKKTPPKAPPPNDFDDFDFGFNVYEWWGGTSQKMKW